MVISVPSFSLSNRRGRPRKHILIEDKGTQELQSKKIEIIDFLTQASSPISSSIKQPSILAAASAGSYIHQLFLLRLIDKKQLEAAMAFQKLYFLAYRSMGIKNRLKSSLGRQDVTKGTKENDLFEDPWIEKRWFFMADHLSYLVNKHKSILPTALKMVLLDAVPLRKDILFSSSLTAGVRFLLDEIAKIIDNGDNKYKRLYH